MLANRGALSLLLASHGYLKKVVSGIAQKASGNVEQKRENAKCFRPRESSNGPVSVGDVLSKPKTGKLPADWKKHALKAMQGGNDEDGD